MFAHQHAWFSSNVPENHRQIWAKEQGQASTNLLDPQVRYFFSNDVNEPQTRKLLDETDKVLFVSGWIADSADVRFRRPLGPYVLQDHAVESYNPPPPPYTPPRTYPQFQRFRRSLDPTTSTPSRLPRNYQPVDLIVEPSPPPSINRFDHQINRNPASQLRASRSESAVFEFDADVEMVERVIRGRRGRRRRSDEVAGADIDARGGRADAETRAVINTNMVEASDEDEELLSPSKRVRKLPDSFGRRNQQKARGKAVAIENEDEGFFQDIQSSSSKHSNTFPTLSSSRHHPPPILPLDHRENITVAEIFSRMRSIADEDLQTDEDVADWLLRDVQDFTPGENGCVAKLNSAWKARTR